MSPSVAMLTDQFIALYLLIFIFSLQWSQCFWLPGIYIQLVLLLSLKPGTEVVKTGPRSIWTKKIQCFIKQKTFKMALSTPVVLPVPDNETYCVSQVEADSFNHLVSHIDKNQFEDKNQCF